MLKFLFELNVLIWFITKCTLLVQVPAVPITQFGGATVLVMGGVEVLLIVA